MRMESSDTRPKGVKTGSFCVYEHWRGDIGKCFYVGKGTLRRSREMGSRNPHHKRIVAKLSRLGITVDVRIVAAGLPEVLAFDLEIKQIADRRADGHPLCNKTSGGEGPSGFKRSTAHSAAILAAIKGKPRSSEVRRKISESLKGREFSTERREKIRKKALGRSLSDEHKQKLAAAQTRVMRNPAAREKIRAAVSGRIVGLETREKIGDAHRGKKVSAETRDKIRAARRLQKMRPVTPETREKMRNSALAREAAKRRCVSRSVIPALD